MSTTGDNASLAEPRAAPVLRCGLAAQGDLVEKMYIRFKDRT